MTKNRFIFAGLTCVALGSWGSAFADSSHSSDAVISGLNKSVVHPLSETHVVIMSDSQQDSIVTTDANSPMNGASGECFGLLEAIEGELSGGGYCNYDDAGGERYVVKWHATGMSEAGAVEGEWSLIGGAGKWVGSSGGGTFSSLTDQETGKFENNITGEITLK